jgi:ribonuclease P protein component
MGDAPDTNPPLHFRPRHRLRHALEFDAVYAAKMRKSRGPISLFSLPNTLEHPRLGLAVGVRAGNAVVRNRWKRMIREAFRLQQHELPRTPEGRGYDYIVSVRPAPDQRIWPLGACAKALAELAAESDREWRKRAGR